MHELFYKLIARLPLDFRILYRQFLLRVVDLESLSVQADVERFLGQFAGVLIMLSLVHATVAYLGYTFITEPASRLAFLWHMEHYLIATTMLVAGLVTVISWDATFPDRRDVMVLSPLPVAPRTILFAKMAASAAVMGLAIATLNVASGVMLPLILGAQPGPALGFFQSFPVWWLTLLAASAFLYGSVLTIQGFTALLLPRRIFLRLSAFLQLAAFGLFLGVYFVQPSLTSPAAMAAAESRWILASSPSYWFWALFHQLNGSLPAQLLWLAHRAWVALLLAVAGAVSCLLLCYLHTMKKTAEEPDLVPGSAGFDWMPFFGNSLQTAIALFSIRSFTRSRQHRVAFAFYLAFVFGLALSLLRSELSVAGPIPVSMDFLIPTFLMMFFAVVGLRNVFSLPISLTANWVLRTTQLHGPEDYVAATRRTLILFAAFPVWLISAALSLPIRPITQVAGCLAVLALLGCILVEISLIGLYKVPFTCSYLPGKANVQLIFWGSLIVLFTFIIPGAEFELSALHNPDKYGFMLSILVGLAGALFVYNHQRAKSAVIYYEELPDEVITTLKLSA
jgi:hypothetical protein